MRISLEWLREYAPLDAPVDTLVEALVDSGTEVARVHRVGDGVVVARVTALEPIPEARTQVVFADLDAGDGATARVITGAPNLQVGDLVPWARPGSELPGFDEPLEIRSMFGGRYESPGMLCSAAELGAGADAAGILILESGAPGQPLHELLPLDVTIDVDVTTNRPDCLCHLGIARELAAVIGDTLADATAEIPAALTSATSIKGRARVTVEDTAGCRRFMAMIIEGVAVGPSPEWLQRRLRSIGQRPLNAIVDVTNFVAHELGEPLHAFDLHRLAEAGGQTGAPELVVRRGRDEVVACLDGVDRTVGPEDMVVCSGDIVVSIAGVIGGGATAVTEATTSVLLEAATWDGPTVRASSRRLGVRTDASTLFEKGLSDGLPPPALHRAAALIAELGGGHVLRGAIDEHPSPLPAPQPLELTTDFLSRRLGYAVDATEAATALARLGFTVEQGQGLLRITAPHFRRDVSIAEDIVEEVGRSLGYGRVPGTLPGRRHGVPAQAPAPMLEEGVRDVLTGAGFDEVISYSFTSRALAAILPGAAPAVAPMALTNPLSEEWTVMRVSLLPGVCQALALNLNHGVADAAVFEVGRAFWEGLREVPPRGSTPDGADQGLPPLPAEPLLLALAIHCSGDDPHGSEAALERVRSVVDWLVRRHSGEQASAVPDSLPAMRTGRAARVTVAGAPVGIVGELAPEAIAALDLRGRVVVGELRLDLIVPAVPRAVRYAAPPRFPAVVQDLSVVVARATPAGEALATIRAEGGPLLETAELYDEYHDDRLGADRKGWTFRLSYRAPDRTLTGEEANRRHEAIAAALVDRCGAALRS